MNMRSKQNKKIPLPNNPYKIYKEENYYKVPFPRYIARILGLSEEELCESYDVKMFVDRERKEVRLQLVSCDSGEE
ncbi:MAG: hypothetical protein BTN85_2208 [Candidatus Methanohalarchaeum thermophilum]|uniref:Uncharacterized protein n=1 Tax=Methanohalarchaeum thermophilum TaxID=1903181 RepID=A0A1Q6DRT3_METT1|nr:MAG: hypothetical protein BTN85_2208 [Candidatus Methanohalarchaeum thermophilum]